MSRPDLSTGVLLLAHRRLRTLSLGLGTKIGLVDVESDVAHNRSPVAHREIEARVKAGVDAVLQILEYGDPVPLLANARLGFRLGRGAVTGTVGTMLPALAARSTADRAWYREAIHRGSADRDLSRLRVPSAELILDAGARALGYAADDVERAKIRALVLGMLADLAAHVVVGPVLRGAAADLSFVDPVLAELAVTDVAGGLTADRLLASRAGRDWRDWWLATAEMPDAFFRGCAEAIAALDAVTSPRGFASRLTTETRGTPLTDAQLKTAYRLYLDGLSNPFTITTPGVPAIGARWNLAQWWGAMIPAFIGPPIALLISAGTDRSKLLWNDAAAADQPDGTSWAELANLGDLAGSVAPFVYTMLMWSGYPRSRYPFGEALGFAGWRLLFGILGLTRGTDSGARTAMLLLQLLPDLIAFVQFFVELGLHHHAPMLIMLIQFLPAICMGLTMLAGAAFRGAHVTWGWDSFFPAWLIVLVICLGLSFVVGAILHAGGGFRLILDDGSTTTGLRATPRVITDLPGVATPEPRATAMVFDDGALFRIPGLGGTPDRGHFAYPSGNRTVVNLVWTGRAPLTLKVDGEVLEFQIAADAPIRITVPPGTTALRLGDLLMDGVRDGGVKKLTVTQAAAGELQPPLGWPVPFSDGGDAQPTRADHAAHRLDAVTVSAAAATPTQLRHAPRAHQGVRFGVAGPATTDLEGWKIVPSAQLGDVDVTAMGAAAELATLLFLGAAPELVAAPIAASGGPLKPVYEVFRRWNLDERAANEWRTLIAGGARPERAAPGGDPLVRGAPLGAAVFDDAGGRGLLDRMGWIPTWRAWTRVATDPTQDTTAAAAAPYSPPDGATRVGPTNDLLSRAIKVLLNL